MVDILVIFQPVDISSIIAERLSAVRKLAENPHDIAAKTVLTQAQKKVCIIHIVLPAF